MKNSIQSIVLSTLFITAISHAQGSANNGIKGNGKVITEKRTTPEYDEIKVSGFFDVNLVSGKEGAITIEGEENLLPYIKIEVDGTVLKIHIENNKNLRTSNGKDIVITVPFETISAISLSGSGDVKTQNTIVADKFSAKLSGSGDLSLAVKATTFESNLSGSGDIIYSGSSDSFKSTLSGSGDIDADDLITKETDATISGSGDMKVFCSESLKARVSGSGDIKYKGNPKTKDTKVSGSGEISKA